MSVLLPFVLLPLVFIDESGTVPGTDRASTVWSIRQLVNAILLLGKLPQFYMSLLTEIQDLIRRHNNGRLLGPGAPPFARHGPNSPRPFPYFRGTNGL